MSGFAEAEVQKLKIEKIFKHFDSDNSGAVDFEEFQAALVRLNFVGVQREVEVSQIGVGIHLLG
jgi:Ca2+-binding EF-hand superfamily protein